MDKDPELKSMAPVGVVSAIMCVSRCQLSLLRQVLTLLLLFLLMFLLQCTSLSSLIRL